MKRKNKTTKYILAGLFLSSMMGVTTACDPLGIEPTTKVLMMKIMVSLVSAPHGVELIKTFVL